MKIEKITHCEFTFKGKTITLTMKRKIICNKNDLCKILEDNNTISRIAIH